MHTRFFAPLLAALFIFLYTYTALSKGLDYHAFRSVLAQSPLISKGAGALAFLLPLAELGIVLLLLFFRTRFAGLYASFVFLVLATSYLGYMVLYTPHLPCSCGGVISSLSWGAHIVLNACLLGLNLTALLLHQKTFYKNSLANPIPPGTGVDGRVENA